jgi:fucose permease
VVDGTSDWLARVAVASRFACFGVVVGSWLARAADVKGSLALPDAEWGNALMALPCGSVVGLLLLRLVAQHLSPRQLLTVTTAGLLLVAPMMAGASTVAALRAGLFGFGVMTSVLNTSVNALAVSVESQRGRPVMGSFHACYSIGVAGGALLAAVASSVGASPAAQLAMTDVVVGAVAVGTTPWLPRDVERAVAGPRSRLWLGGGLWALGGLALCSAVSEGTISVWSSVYVRESLGATGTVGAVAFGCFAAAMTVGRLVGDRLVHRLGRASFLVRSSALAASGMVVTLMSDDVVGACVGLALVGCGLACVVPTVMGAAGAVTGRSAMSSVTLISLCTWPAFLLGPPVIGWLASHSSLRLALGVPALAAVSMVMTARRGPAQRYRVRQLSAS